MGLRERLRQSLAGRRTTPFSAVPVADGVADVFRAGIDRSEAQWVVPVLEIAYYPQRDGRIDRSVTGDVDQPVDHVRKHVTNTSFQTRSALEAGSAYHRYKDPSSQPAVRYEVVEHLEFPEALPVWRKPGHRVPMTDYNAIMNRVDIAKWVAQGVKQVWIWGYHGGVIDMWESNMAGPHGDISNSDRDPHDLPVLGQTYTVFHYNYSRGPSEAVEDHIHQIEAVLRTMDSHLFWDKFVGRTGEGRCGWAHFPPNGVRDYDWMNPRSIATDIEDWQPTGGPQIRLDSRRWNRDSLTWFVYWMQNVPGANNGLTYQGRELANWWWFIADLDDALSRGVRLAN